MANQYIDYTNGGDTGEVEPTSIQPILDGQRADETNLKRPSENLRSRTEIVRNALEEIKFLDDADRAMLLADGGIITWHGLSAGPNQGKFTITSNLILRSFLAPATCTPPKIEENFIRYRGITTPSGIINPPRAYTNANKYTLRIEGAVDATLAITVAGAPANDFTLTLNTSSTPGVGTTRQQVVDLLQAVNVYHNAGFTAELNGGGGADILYPIDDVKDDLFVFSGAVDAEKHVITPAGLASFFTTGVLVEGDTLCIWYDDLLLPLYGGRRQSISEAPELKLYVDGNLFLLRLHPERLPYALPLATVQGSKLCLLNNAIFDEGESSTLTGEYVRRVGDTMSGNLSITVTGATTALTTVGGSSSSTGANFTGGATNGDGATGHGTGTGKGLVGLGGAGGGAGVSGTGGTGAPGISGIAGTGSVGGSFTGNGSWAGVHGTGGSSGGYGVQGTAGAGSTGVGVLGESTGSSGIGVRGNGNETSATAVGVAGYCAQGIGVYGSGTPGVKGEGDSGGDNPGVVG